MDSRPSTRRPTRTPHPARPTTVALRPAATPLALAARSAPTVAGLRIDPDGHLVEVPVPRRATLWALAEFTDTAHGPARVCSHTLDRDLVLWTGPTGDGSYNPVASVVAAMFGRPGRITGPVVFTGWTSPTPEDPAGHVDHIGVALVLLLAGTAADCDLGDRTAQRAAELARLELHIAAPPGEADAESSAGEAYDALRHTVTRDGGWPRCATCDEITVHGHDEHHPDALVITQPARVGR